MKKVAYNGLFILTLLFAIIPISSFTPKSADTDIELIDEFEVYPPLPNNLYKSDRYSVTIGQNNSSADSYVYMGSNEFPLNSRPFMTDFNHWTAFSFSGTVTVSVTIPSRTTINSSIVRPKSRNITPTISGNTVSFTVDKPENLYVEIDGEEEHPIFIFANPMETNIPSPNDPGVIYFGPGVHDIGETYNNIDSGTTIYIAGGAYVKGLLKGKINANPITIRGRGILSGIEYPHEETWTKHLIDLPGSQNQTDITLEGIILTNGPKACVTTRGATLVDNVKFLGFERNSDGISTGANSVIKNSFFKVNDDSIKLFDNNMQVFNNVIWQQVVGSIFQLSWNLQRDVTNVEVYDIDVIHFDRVQGTLAHKLNGAVIGCRNIRGGNLSNIHFSNIRLEHQPYQLMGLQIKDDMLGFDEGTGSIQGITVTDVLSERTPRIISYIDGNGTNTGEINDVEFCNILYGGNKVSKIEDLTVIENPQNVSNINLIPAQMANAGTDKTISCSAQDVVIGNANTLSPGFTFSWTTTDGSIISGASESQATVNKPGTYTLTVSSPMGACSESDTVTVTTSTSFNVDGGEDKIISCSNDPVTVGKANNLGTGHTYLWSTTDGTILSGVNQEIATVDTAGTYILTVTRTADGCSSTDSVLVISAVAFNVDSGEDKTINCSNDPVTVGKVNSLGTGHTYLWSTTNGTILSGVDQEIATAAAAGTYTLTVTRTIDGCVASDTVVVMPSSSFNTNAGEDKVLDCNTEIQEIGTIHELGTGHEYLWETQDGHIVSGANQEIAMVDTKGTYTLTIINNSSGCSSSDSVVVAGDSSSLSINIGEDRTLNADQEKLVLEVDLNFGDGYSFRWETVDGNIILGEESLSVEVNMPGTYTLTVTSPTGCAGSDTLIVRRQDVENPLLIYPNPVNDGFFWVENGNLQYLNVSVFTENGKLLFNRSLGEGTNKIDVSNLSVGAYTLVFYATYKSSKTIKLLVR